MFIIAPSQEAQRDIFPIFYYIEVCCIFSLESPSRGDSNEYTQYSIFSIKKKIALNYSISATMGFFQGAQKRVRNRKVNEPSVVEPLKFYCIYAKAVFIT